MPLERLMLILVIVVAAAGATIWVGSILVASTVSPGGALAIAIPTALVAYIIWRVIAERLGNDEDDHYDRIEK
ncbi:hypothetical protein [Flavimaricola marinus]|uniref:Uncharacterized protein n=1 Tax=Flavimaricola marinus TaxID=1819565 RepID=A0A238LE39_9RHOB|nr:hypothetical protein [Flavimaricola marinus]SMY07891.1 hypothetical protein LOM8899_02034 [Flavimaricola marinus]